MLDNFQVVEEKPDHHFRTEIPNIVELLGLKPNDIAVYFKIKRPAGDGGRCTRSIPRMAKELGICANAVRTSIKKLKKPFLLIGGKPLIRSMERKKENKSNETNVVVVVNIWPENGAYFRKEDEPTPPSLDEPPPLQNMNPPPSSDEGKEEPHKKNHINKDNVPSKKGKGKRDYSKSLDVDQKKAFDKVMKHKPQWGKPPKPDDVCAWMLAKKCKPERVIEALNIYQQDVEDAIKSGRTIDNMGGSVCAILKGDRRLRIDDYAKNKAFAKSKAKEHKFLEMTRNYVKINAGNDPKEMMFNIREFEFRTRLAQYIENTEFGVYG